jgi:hypothetical protein
MISAAIMLTNIPNIIKQADFNIVFLIINEKYKNIKLMKKTMYTNSYLEK